MKIETPKSDSAKVRVVIHESSDETPTQTEQKVNAHILRLRFLFAVPTKLC